MEAFIAVKEKNNVFAMQSLASLSPLTLGNVIKFVLKLFLVSICYWIILSWFSWRYTILFISIKLIIKNERLFA